MKKHLTILAAQIAFVLGLSPLGAQQTRPIFVDDPAAERIPNLDQLKTEVREYHNCTCKCGCYAHDVDREADRAIAYLDRRVARRRPNERLALILDIDETTLSNYVEESGADFAYKPDAFDAWVQTARAAAIPGTLRLYQQAQKLGVSIFFITGRTENERNATELNLRAQGFQNWKLLVMRPVSHGNQTIGQFKAVTRGEIAGQGYTLALNVGDQWSDLRGKPEAEYSVKYPDPFYFVP